MYPVPQCRIIAREVVRAVNPTSLSRISPSPGHGRDGVFRTDSLRSTPKTVHSFSFSVPLCLCGEGSRPSPSPEPARPQRGPDARIAHK